MNATFFVSVAIVIEIDAHTQSLELRISVQTLGDEITFQIVEQFFGGGSFGYPTFGFLNYYFFLLGVVGWQFGWFSLRFRFNQILSLFVSL